MLLSYYYILSMLSYVIIIILLTTTYNYILYLSFYLISNIKKECVSFF